MEQIKTPAIDDLKNPFKNLTKLKEVSSQNAKMIVSFLSQLSQAYEAFGNNLQTITQGFRKETLKRFGQDTDKFPFLDYLETQIIAIKDIHINFSNKLKAQVVLPYGESAQVLNTATDENIGKLQKFFLSLETANMQMKKSQENYYKAEENVGKLQEALEKLAREKKPLDAVIKAQEKIIKAKVEAEEIKRLYKTQIKDINNQYWTNLYTEYQKVFESFDQVEEKKDTLNRESFTKLIQSLNLFYSQGEYVEVRKNDLVDLNNPKYKQNNPNAPGVLQFLTKGSLEVVFRTRPLDSFIPYEPKKKIEEVVIIKMMNDEDYNAYFGATSEHDLHYLLDFLFVFLPKESKKNLLEQSSLFKSTVMSSPGNIGQNRLNAFQKYELQQKVANVPQLRKSSGTIGFPIEEKVEEKIWHIITNKVNRKFFIENLVNQRDPVSNSFRLRLAPKVHAYLSNFLVKLLKILLEEKDYEAISNLLASINKYYTLKEFEIYYIYNAFEEIPIWEEPDIWLNIIKNGYEKGNKNEEAKTNKTSKANESAIENASFVRKIVHFGGGASAQKSSQVFEMEKPSDLNKGKEALASLIRANIAYISRLSKSVNSTNSLVIKLSTQFELDKERIQELVNQEKQEFIGVLREKFYNYRYSKKKRAEKKWGAYYKMYLVLDFLDIIDLLKFLELNKEYRRMFQKRIYRTIFTNYGQLLVSKQRAQIWHTLLEPKTLNVSFQELLKKFNDSINEPAFIKFKEVIELDVQRSFSTFDQDDKEKVQEILRAYATHDTEVGYVQGMNYIAGYLYAILQDQEKTFLCFAQVMQLYMKKHIYLNFQKLKLYCSKFDQILELYKPKLSIHFQNEKVEAPYYVTSWLLTIFVSSFKYKQQPKLLEEIWDFFLLDGPSITFKVAILIMTEYENTMLGMNFALILSFLTELGRGEFSMDCNEFKEKEKQLPEEKSKELKFVTNFGKNIKSLKGFNQLLLDISEGQEVFETQLSKLSI